MASVVFEKMLFGNFKEARMGPDEPILLDKVDPQVFECAMRYKHLFRYFRYFPGIREMGKSFFSFHASLTSALKNQALSPKKCCA
jgi:hypothetical protein